MNGAGVDANTDGRHTAPSGGRWIRLRRLDMPEFFAPTPLLAVALMALNDHLLKARLHNAATGKLSDLAACFFLPTLVSGVLGLVFSMRMSLRLVLGAATTALVFGSLELSDTAGSMFAAITTTLGAPLGIHRVALTRDPTDLLALLMIPVGCVHALWATRRRDDAALAAITTRGAS